MLDVVRELYADAVTRSSVDLSWKEAPDNSGKQATKAVDPVAGLPVIFVSDAEARTRSKTERDATNNDGRVIMLFVWGNRSWRGEEAGLKAGATAHGVGLARGCQVPNRKTSRASLSRECDEACITTATAIRAAAGVSIRSSRASRGWESAPRCTKAGRRKWSCLLQEKIV